MTPEQLEQLQNKADEEGWAPRDVAWHRQYAKTFALLTKHLEQLRNHPAFKEAEDLGDYAETIHTLITFRPHTDRAIEIDVMEEVFHVEVEALRSRLEKAMKEGQ